MFLYEIYIVIYTFFQSLLFPNYVNKREGERHNNIGVVHRLNSPKYYLHNKNIRKVDIHIY